MAPDDGAAGDCAGCRVSGRDQAVALWGAAAVDRALAERDPAPMTQAFAAEICTRAHDAADDEAFARWALTLSWSRFAALVRLVAGVTRRSLTEN